MASPETHIYQCQGCGHVEAVQSTVLDTGIVACNACGLTSKEGDLMMQDTLAKMFQDRMNLTSSMQQAPRQETVVSPVKFSISQHYHHSAHLAADSNPDPDPSPAVFDTRAFLLERNIEPSSLHPSLFQRFEEAAPDERDRLIEIWRASRLNAEDTSPGIYGSSMNLDEQLAGAEYELEMVSGRVRNYGMQMGRSSSGGILQGTHHGDWHSSEPYMKSGYEILAERDYNEQSLLSRHGKDSYNHLGSVVGYRPSSDPAFSGREWWRDFVDSPSTDLHHGFPSSSAETNSARQRLQEDEEMQAD